jgi:MoaA/NifB/PqqE/SkfB family radical SAM enzyme
VSPERVDLKVGFACNNRCTFCVQGDKRDRHPPRAMSELRRRLVEGRWRGATDLVITGGEPTVRDDIIPLIRLARTLGYREVQIQTNGRRFHYLPWCRSAVAAGATEFSPALHGSRPDIHDALTRAEGSFSQTVRGIENLVSLGQRVITNTVITRTNQADLPALAALLVGLGVRQFQLAFVHILGTAAAEWEAVVPRKSEVMPFVQRALDIGRGAGVACFTEAIPLCLMGGYEAHVAEARIPSTVVFDAEAVIDDYSDYRRSQGKAKGPPCQSCRHASVCEGPWREYPERYGWDEFQPIS